MSRECSLDTVAARNVVKVAIVSKVAIKDALSREGEVGCNMPTQGEDNPFASLVEMEDECLPDYIHQMPTLTSSGSAMKLDCIIECADATDGGCDVEKCWKWPKVSKKGRHSACNN